MSKGMKVKHASFREGVPQLASRQNISTTGGGGAHKVDAIEAIGPGLVVMTADKDVLVPWPMVLGCEIEREAVEDVKPPQGKRA